jgi:hypothetical protein
MTPLRKRAMSCEAWVIDPIDVRCVEPSVRQAHSSLLIKNIEDALYLHPSRPRARRHG